MSRFHVSIDHQLGRIVLDGRLEGTEERILRRFLLNKEGCMLVGESMADLGIEEYSYSSNVDCFDEFNILKAIENGIVRFSGGQNVSRTF